MRIVFFDLSVLCWLRYRQRHKRAFLFKATTTATGQPHVGDDQAIVYFHRTCVSLPTSKLFHYKVSAGDTLDMLT
jgi:hypothetical protein